MIPLTTTTVTVHRVAVDPIRDGYDPLPAPVVIAAAVPAHISAPGGDEDRDGGTRELTAARLLCQTTDLLHTDRVVDDSTGITFEVLAVQHRRGLGLDHTVADLQRITGAVA